MEPTGIERAGEIQQALFHPHQSDVAVPVRSHVNDTRWIFSLLVEGCPEADEGIVPCNASNRRQSLSKVPPKAIGSDHQPSPGLCLVMPALQS
ncbi:MAG: hypothetical protein EB071_09555 [Gammaproteobacteria bacterium]|nr:hypothetical protein [Gammaproteobacteria bacterium]